MMDRLVECVPNVSEGRNEDTLRALAEAVSAVPRVALLDQQRDRDHHRAVLTFVGTPDAVAEAAVALVRAAAERIDLRRHQGAHPRVGATDVVPFVPIRGVTMEDCVELARRVGERIGAELGIPVFLYERAASSPERAPLENIRRGGLEGLATRMREAAWHPDFGPRTVHPSAGATVVGARPILIAYNVNLQTGDLAVAKAIAKKVRWSGGGLPHVKAIGLELSSRGLVQVSMNLTNYEETPLHVAFEAVRSEAARQQVRIAGSEVIGLVPQQALIRAAESLLQLQGFAPGQVLEPKLASVLGQMPGIQALSSASRESATSGLHPFLEAVSTGSPTPAGGSVAALAGALACSLGIMACRVGAPVPSQPPGRSNDKPDNLHATEQRLIELCRRFEELVQADAEAYASYMNACRLPKTDRAREDMVGKELGGATEVSLEIAALACEAAAILRLLPARTKPSVLADLTVGLKMALVAVEGGLFNAEENIKHDKKHQLMAIFQDKIQTLKEKLVELNRL